MRGLLASSLEPASLVDGVWCVAGHRKRFRIRRGPVYRVADDSRPEPKRSGRRGAYPVSPAGASGYSYLRLHL
jgi:hypothetical protein